SIRKTFPTQQSRVLSDRGGHQIRRSQAVVRTSSRELLVNPSRLTRIWAKRLNAPRIPSARRKAVHNVTGRRTDINTLTVDENTVDQSIRKTFPTQQSRVLSDRSNK